MARSLLIEDDAMNRDVLHSQPQDLLCRIPAGVPDGSGGIGQ